MSVKTINSDSWQQLEIKQPGAPEPGHHVPPPTGQKVKLLVPGVGWVGQDGGGLSDQVSVTQNGETQLGHPCNLKAGVYRPL